jgi:hypothetical protein
LILTVVTTFKKTSVNEVKWDLSHSRRGVRDFLLFEVKDIERSWEAWL